MTSSSSIRITNGPPPADEVLRDIPTEACGAVVLVATLARGGALDVSVAADARSRLEVAARSVLSENVRASRIAHAQGRVSEGQPMVVAAAAAVHRDDAFTAAQQLLNALKGVATRREA